MRDVEKVISVLSKYKKHAFGDKDEKVTVEEIIAMLKAQEPMVMTLEEFQSSENNPKWLETKDGKHNRWTLGNAGYEKFYDNCMMGYLSIEEYGRRWRCWTFRPDEKRRAETPWTT